MNCQINSLFPLPSCKKIVALAAVSFCLLGAGRAQAQTTIDYYDFNSSNLNRSTTYGDQTPTHLATTNGATVPTSLSTTVASANVMYFTGTSTNAQTGDAPGKDLGLQSGTTDGNNGKNIQFSTNTIGYQNLQISYATEASSATAFTTQELFYAVGSDINNNNYTSAGKLTTLPTSYTTETFNLSGFQTLNNASSVSFRIVFNGATGSSTTNNRIDNLTLSSTPAPPGFVSAGIGFAVTGLGALLRRRKQSKATDTATPEAAA